MSSIISSTRPRDDDLVDFLLSHHEREERESRCFAIDSKGGRWICARCSGWVIGALISMTAILGGATAFPGDLFFLFPIPAFIDWGGRKLRFFQSDKKAGFITGMIMGLAVPGFVFGAIRSEQYALAGFAIYLVAFTAITTAASRKGRIRTEGAARIK